MPGLRAAVAVEQASFYPSGKPKENYKRENSPLTDIAQANGVDRKMLVWAKAVWDAAEGWRESGGSGTCGSKTDYL